MSLLTNSAAGEEEPGALERNSALLASLTFLFVMLPALRSMPGGQIRFSILLSLVLFAAMYVNSRRRWAFVLGVLIGAAAVAATVVSEATGEPAWRMVATGLGLGLMMLTILMMLNSLVRAERVSSDTIIGGICVYLMIGLAFALGYILVLYVNPSALQGGGVALGQVYADSSSQGSAKTLYFSFVTLTTLGFGDITPHGEAIQTMVVTEAIIGQLYVAIFIARLMALYISGDREDRAQATQPRDSDTDS